MYIKLNKRGLLILIVIKRYYNKVLKTLIIVSYKTLLNNRELTKAFINIYSYYFNKNLVKDSKV